jgi:ankyrin repeat protein
MSRPNDKLVEAAMRCDVPCIAAALLAGADPNVVDAMFHNAPLHWAAIFGHVPAIAALVAAGAHVDIVSNRGPTPLMIAAFERHTAAVNALLAAGADVHRVNNGGDTALHLASTRGRMDAARALVDAGARTDVLNKEGKRPIDVVRALTCSLAQLLACLMQLRVCVTLLHGPVDVHRLGGARRP